CGATSRGQRGSRAWRADRRGAHSAMDNREHGRALAATGQSAEPARGGARPAWRGGPRWTDFQLLAATGTHHAGEGLRPRTRTAGRLPDSSDRRGNLPALECALRCRAAERLRNRGAPRALASSAWLG